jgi:hypothetical protein
VSEILTPFPWSPLKLHSDSTPWSGNGVGVTVCGVGVTVCGVGVTVCGVGVTVCGVGVRMELKLKGSVEFELKSVELEWEWS